MNEVYLFKIEIHKYSKFQNLRKLETVEEELSGKTIIDFKYFEAEPEGN